MLQRAPAIWLTRLAEAIARIRLASWPYGIKTRCSRVTGEPPLPADWDPVSPPPHLCDRVPPAVIEPGALGGCHARLEQPLPAPVPGDVLDRAPQARGEPGEIGSAQCRRLRHLGTL